MVRKDVENVSKLPVEAPALGTLGRRSLKKVKAARRAGWALVEGGAENSPQNGRFLPPFQ
jgi:hypothetical protein